MTLLNPPPLVASTAWTRTTELDEAADLCRAALYQGQHLQVTGDAGRFSLRRRVMRVGGVSIADLAFGSDVRIACWGERGDYSVVMPLTGRIASRFRGRHHAMGPGDVTVYPADGDVAIPLWAADSRVLVAKFERAVVDDALRTMTGRPVPGPIDFTSAMPSTPAARGWTDLLTLLNGQFEQEGSVVRRAPVALPLADGLVRGLLLAADHPYRGALDVPDRPAPPAAVRAAVGILEDGADSPLTTGELARRCHVSVRALQDGFRRHVGASPMAYLRDVRLRRAHEALRAADPARTTVAALAFAWGFTHLGRFAAAHRARYGVTPAETLRAASGTG